MSKGLEALKEVREKTDAGFIYDYHNKEHNPLNIIEKELKALEIIKEKFNLQLFCDNKNGFIGMVAVVIKGLNPYVIYETHNKEEYDVLKEVLKNE